MDWPSILQYVELCLGIALVVRLLSLHLHRVYRYFCIFLLADVSGILIWLIHTHLEGTAFQFDYRVPWLVERGLVWIFTLMTVYALLDAILAHLPGILTLSRRILNVSLIVALVIGLFTAWPEYHAALSTEVLVGRLAHIVAAAIVFERVIASVALITLVCILLFLFWFPVEMPRNLAAFFTGFVIYLALKTCLVLTLSLWSNQSPEFYQTVNMLIGGMSAAVFAYWVVFITPSGEKASAKLSVAPAHSRQEDLLMAQLEAMNASLLRAVRR